MAPSINFPIESKYILNFPIPADRVTGLKVKEAVLRITVMSFLKRAMLINCAWSVTRTETFLCVVIWGPWLQTITCKYREKTEVSKVCFLEAGQAQSPQCSEVSQLDIFPQWDWSGMLTCSLQAAVRRELFKLYLIVAPCYIVISDINIWYLPLISC